MEEKKSLRERFISAREERRQMHKSAELNKLSIRLHEYVDMLESRVEDMVAKVRNARLDLAEEDVMREIGDNLKFLISDVHASPQQISHKDLAALSGYQRLHSFCKDENRDIACKIDVRWSHTSVSSSDVHIDINVDKAYDQSTFIKEGSAARINRDDVPAHAATTAEDALPVQAVDKAFSIATSQSTTDMILDIFRDIRDKKAAETPPPASRKRKR